MIPLVNAIFPAHQIWHRIDPRVRANDLQSHSLSAGRFGATLKSNLSDAGYEYGNRFPPHCFRRWATQELKVDGSSDAQIKGAGFWRAMGFRSYADTLLTDALEISRLVATASLSESEDAAGAPSNVAVTESMRKRLRPFPSLELV